MGMHSSHNPQCFVGTVTSNSNIVLLSNPFPNAASQIMKRCDWFGYIWLTYFRIVHGNDFVDLIEKESKYHVDDKHQDR